MYKRQLTTLCLFFIVKINAQSTSSTSSVKNQIDLTLIVKDSSSGQEFSLHAQNYHDVFHQIDTITYNISLDYKSDLDITSYFRIKCVFLRIPSATDPVGFADYPMLGATAPVIIPPVKKKKREARKPFKYPYLAKVTYPIRPTNYEVAIKLLKYESYEDYIAASNNYIVKSTKTIYINAAHNLPSSRNASMVAYPNPSMDYLIIKHTNTSVKNTPLEVIIFNDKGVQVSQHTLVNSSIETNSSSYNLDTSQLQNGTYYVQLSHEGKTQVKTIIKE